MLYQRLASLGFSLPDVPAPLAAYVPAVISGSLCLTSGQLPLQKGHLLEPGGKGVVGHSVTKEEAQHAAECCALNALAAAAAATGGIEKIKRVVKVTVFVASSDDFTEQPFVANGASLFFGKLFSEHGGHARSAVGVRALPLGASVEVEVIFELH